MFQRQVETAEKSILTKQEAVGGVGNARRGGEAEYFY